MISSTNNPRIKWLRDLQANGRARREAGAYIVEGVRLVEEAQASGIQPLLVIYTPDLGARGLKVVDAFSQRGAPVEQVPPQVFKAASDTQAPQGILAVLPTRPIPLPPGLDFVLILDGLRDPGNVGTILRTAAAAGAQAVMLSSGSVDPYAPKVVRSAMGAHFHLSISIQSWPEIETALASQNAGRLLAVFLAEAGGGLAYTQADFRQPLALIVGGEAEGAGQQAHALAVQRVRIPMLGQVESLNAAIAAALILFEVVRQRSNRGSCS
jgi:RNA methyltransferase, TrmH family